MEQYVVGGSIVSYCTKCRLGLDHTIVAMEDDKIAKVECKTCHSRHKFRDPASVKRRRPSKKDDPSKSPAAVWEAALASAKGREQAYSMAARYRVGDIVVHDRFGKGIVVKTHSNKCEVLFQDCGRLMASAN